jgi:hypothetical protein
VVYTIKLILKVPEFPAETSAQLLLVEKGHEYFFTSVSIDVRMIYDHHITYMLIFLILR